MKNRVGPGTYDNHDDFGYDAQGVSYFNISF